MAGGTLNLFPVTGVTIPFLSQGGVALSVNLVEIGMVLAIVRRLEGSNV
jgi:cell division protein FtsW